MTSGILHIKDSYYFEVPKFLARSHRENRDDFPDYWVRLDPDYQDWEAGKFYDALAASPLMHSAATPDKAALLGEYATWRGGSHNFAKPFTVFLDENTDLEWFHGQLKTELAQQTWEELKAEPVAKNYLEEYKASAESWTAEKVEEYNHQLDGKILIPQPFGTLKNNYEAASGFCISRYMIIELLVALIVCFAFIRLANRMKKGGRPEGKLWNMLEAILIYFRDEVARPAIGEQDAARFTPLLWTIFLFILGCNLFGMLPWMGAPTSAFGATLGMAFVVFATGLVFGTKRLGVLGYWKNLVPEMGLPWYMAVVIVPMIFLIEALALFIKHTVLGIRLLANMVAGHLVLLAIMGLAVAAAGTSSWGVTASIAIVGSVLFSCLELFVAFLQAYVFTFLSALFIGAAIHHH